MAEYPTYTVDDVALVSGTDADDYTPFIDEALKMATLLFKYGTCLQSFPDNSDDAELARYAILSMAWSINAVQPFQEILSNPFNSETIGSYSYSKLNSAVSAGLPTGIGWFDLAVSRLGICDFGNGQVTSGGINVFEENKFAHDGYSVFLAPQDLHTRPTGPWDV